MIMPTIIGATTPAVVTRKSAYRIDFLKNCGQYPCLVDGTKFDLFDLFERSHMIAYYGLQGISSNVERNRLTTVMGFTPLVLACARGNEENVEALLPHNKAGNIAQNGHLALYFASLNGHEAVVRLLLSYGVAVNTQINEWVLDLDKVSVKRQTAHGWTALIAAFWSGHKAVVEYFLSRKDIAVNIQTEDGWTALIAASRFGHDSVVNLLS